MFERIHLKKNIYYNRLPKKSACEVVFVPWEVVELKIWVIPCQNKEKKGQRQKIIFL